MSELKHYGVLGMKWGIRKVRKNELKSKMATYKGDKRGAQKYAAKAAKIKSKHMGRTDKKTYDLVSKTSTGKLAVQSMLIGTPYGALKYNQAIANNSTRGRAIVKGMLYGAGDVSTAGLMSVIEPRLRK